MLFRSYRKRNAVEAAIGVQLPSAGNGNGYHRGDAGVEPNDYLQKIALDGISGTVIVSSDHHYWPNQPPSLAVWQQILNGDLSPKEHPPSPQGSSGPIVYSRVSGVQVGSSWRGQLTNPGQSSLSVSRAPISWPISSLERGSLEIGRAHV